MRKFSFLSGIFLFVLALPLTLIVTQHTTDNRERAAASASSYPANIEYDPSGYGMYNTTALTNPNIQGVDINLNWASVEPQQGVFNFAPADKELSDWALQGKKAVLVVRFREEGGAPNQPNCTGDTNPGSLPTWEVPRIKHFCDTDKGMIIPDYLDPQFITDAKTYVGAVANHFAQSPYKNSIIYVRVGLTLGGESFVLMPCTAITPGCDYQTDVNQFLAYGYTPTAWISYEKDMLSFYKSLFNYTTLMYGINSTVPLESSLNVNPTTGNLIDVDVAEWAASQGIGIGQQGLSPSTNYGTYAGLSTIISFIKAHYPTTYVQFQTVHTINQSVTSTCDVTCVIQGDISNAQQYYAKSIEWYNGDDTNGSYQPYFQTWQQYVNSAFGATTPTVPFSPTPSSSGTLTPPPTCAPMPPQCQPGSKLGIVCPAPPGGGWCPSPTGEKGNNFFFQHLPPWHWGWGR